MWPEKCLPVKVYVILVILSLLLSCLINIFVDYFNNIPIFSSMLKNAGGSCCCCLSSILLIALLGYFCYVPAVRYATWGLVALILLCSLSAICGNFFYVYSYNPRIIY